jgi:small ligand-binding sensory domain FIST
MPAANLTSMKWASALSTRPSLEAAIDEVTQQAQDALGAPADLGLIFISTTFTSEYPRVLPLLQERLSVPHLIGCGGVGVIGQNATGEAHEIEEEPALSLMLAHLPGVNLHTFHVDADDLPDLDSSPANWVELLEVPPEPQPHFIVLADSLTSKISDLLQGLDYAYPGSAKIGGLTSAISVGSGSGLFCDGELYREGTVGVALSGNITVETIVAQGCRPIGQPYRIAEAERNILLKVEALEESGAIVTAPATPSSEDVLTPLEALQDLIQDLDERDQTLAQHSLFVGIVRDEFKQNIEPGDFLIRNLVGVDPRVGAIAIGDRIRPGQRIQFHLRDASASAEDLETLLAHHQQASEAQPAGALLFTCLGRGEGLYGQPDFDSYLFSRYFHNIPLGGFFCHGEIGPIGPETFLHGYTSAFGIFRSLQP